MDMKEIRSAAREQLKGKCRVCPACDGRACAGEVPGMGGAGSGDAFKENVRAFAALKLNLRTLHDVTEPDCSLDLFGLRLDMPVMGAPVAGGGINLGNAVSEEELAEAMHQGCRDGGTVCWSGDGFDPAMYLTGLAAIKRQNGKGIPTIKPRGAAEIIKRVRLAEDAGVPAVAVDVDTAGFINMTSKGQSVGPTTPADIEAVVKATELPVILKGVMTPDEASLAASLGAAGIVVSNHGGRVMEACPATLAVLPEIAAAVKGRIKIFLDGGVRNGADVLKALALGADAVLVGRPLIVAAAGGGAAGVALAVRTFGAQLNTAMVLTGTESVGRVSSRVVRPSGAL